jgi:isocitrate lyase
VHF